MSAEELTKIKRMEIGLEQHLKSIVPDYEWIPFLKRGPKSYKIAPKETYIHGFSHQLYKASINGSLADRIEELRKMFPYMARHIGRERSEVHMALQIMGMVPVPPQYWSQIVRPAKLGAITMYQSPPQSKPREHPDHPSGHRRGFGSD